MFNYKFALFIIIYSLVIGIVSVSFIESNLWPSSEFGKIIGGFGITLLYVVGGNKAWEMFNDQDDN
jgi:hypothetical protein